jgi:hypothetical protein
MQGMHGMKEEDMAMMNLPAGRQAQMNADRSGCSRLKTAPNLHPVWYADVGTGRTCRARPELLLEDPDF